MSTAQLVRVIDSDSGEYLVVSERSSYVLDLNARTVTRRPVADDGNPSNLRLDGEPIPLVTLERLELGAEASLVLRIRTDGVLTFRLTSPVVSIERRG